MLKKWRRFFSTRFLKKGIANTKPRQLYHHFNGQCWLKSCTRLVAKFHNLYHILHSKSNKSIKLQNIFIYYVLINVYLNDHDLFTIFLWVNIVQPTTWWRPSSSCASSSPRLSWTYFHEIPDSDTFPGFDDNRETGPDKFRLLNFPPSRTLRRK